MGGDRGRASEALKEQQGEVTDATAEVGIWLTDLRCDQSESFIKGD